MRIADAVSVLSLPTRARRGRPIATRPAPVPTRSSWLRRLAWALHLAR